MKKCRVIRILLWGYMFVLFGITVFRPGISEWRFLGGEVNISLFEWYLPLIQAGDWGRIVYLLVGNIVWFVPFGVYMGWRKRALSSLKIALVGLGLSLVIEGMQYILGTGYSELDDLILNTAGAWIGGEIYFVFEKKRGSRKV